MEISSLYVDITKDRLYCDAASSPRRQATQAVMGEVFRGLCRLLAPVLIFTADEAWEFAGCGGSVHLELFPEPNPAWRDEEAENTIDHWIKLRATVAQAVEAARQQKMIGKALEATVTLEIANPALLASTQARLAELEEFCILSDLQLVPAQDTQALVMRNLSPRCGRCWRQRPSVGLSAAHPELCDRCTEVVEHA